MSTLYITESATVQMSLIRHAAEVGWVPVQSQESLACRGGSAELEDILKALLHQLMTGEMRVGELDASELSRMEGPKWTKSL